MHTNRILLAFAAGTAAFTLAACDNATNPTSPAPNSTSSTTTTTTPKTTQPDNTAHNERDRGTNAPTPTDQGESAADRQITADVRKAIMAEPGMSTNAQNCKIITKNGVVTLRGPVASQSEKDTIAAKARAAAGVTSVVNELEVAPK